MAAAKKAEVAVDANPAQTQEPTETIVAYKGFDRNMQCRGYQFAIGQTYEHDGKVEACASGFHACEHPLDVLEYYAPSESRYAVVEQRGDLSRHGEDTKVASRLITIKSEIDIAGLVRAAIEWTTKRCLPIDPASPASAAGYRGAASATGDRGAASAAGYQGAASATGYRGAASATGDQGAASATGNRGVAVACGAFGRAMAAASGAIVLSARNADGSIRYIRASKVGDNGVEPDVWYSLNEAGEFVAVPQ